MDGLDPSRAGQLLVAAPELGDPNFLRTLVYLAEHNAEGALGFVLNRPANRALSDVARGPALKDALLDVPVFWGGPVRPDTLTLALFTADADQRVTCHLGMDAEDVAAHIERGDGWARAFAGYAGWSASQLEDEIREGAWVIGQPDPALFDDRLLSGLWTVMVNGEKVCETDNLLPPYKGGIAFQQHTPNALIQYRGARIRPLKNF